MVLRTGNFVEMHSVEINDTITEAHFLNSSNTFLIVFAASSTIIVDLTTNTQYPIFAITPTSLNVDNQNNLFTCNNNIIKQNQILLRFPNEDLESEFYIPLNSTGE